ncbi:hypothetical protein BKA82DRAFT_880903 [Pisolithus tinctorius]|uniref:Secreted protein n=1 Tax=Pisolithus tinctorius Marx 270 TaxID=870435 RepID=A0A0C3JNY6_PISTI|nr:hypothetical protein BKA82DRAFT_880903 [Pisolithus tinctorius]KIO10873.1 hypothetical protein M404DRAFT_880903 [Pisolithus tinctorius Marx 270]
MFAWPPTFSYLIALILVCGCISFLHCCCLPVDSWVVPVVADNREIDRQQDRYKSSNDSPAPRFCEQRSSDHSSRNVFYFYLYTLCEVGWHLFIAKSNVSINKHLWESFAKWRVRGRVHSPLVLSRILESSMRPGQARK